MRARTMVAAGLLMAVAITPCCERQHAFVDLLLLKSWPEGGRTPATLGLAYEELTFPTAGGKNLVGWYVPSTTGRARATVLVHTGMQGNLADYLEIFPGLAGSDLDVFAYNWQGYGSSEGRRRFVNFEPDMHAAVNFLRSRPQPAAKPVVHMGISLGSAAALGAAAYSPDETIGVVVLGAFEPARLPIDYAATQISPFWAPMGAIDGAFFAIWATPFLSPSTHIQNVKVPILAVIARDDDIVPPVTQLRVFKRFPQPKSIVNTFGGHYAAARTDPNLVPKIAAWINKLPGLLPARHHFQAGPAMQR